MLAGGGRTLEDLRILRRDDGLRCVVGLDDLPSSDASGDWMRRMGANESGGLAGLQRVISMGFGSAKTAGPPAVCEAAASEFEAVVLICPQGALIRPHAAPGKIHAVQERPMT
jgi:hypothetical protein